MFNFIKNLDRRTVKRILVILLIVMAVAGAIAFISDWWSHKNITFKLSSATKSIVIYDDVSYGSYAEGPTSVKPVAELSKSGVVSLKVGSYYVIPSGDSISTSATQIDVTEDKTIKIDPYYSEDYLSKHFSDQISDIDAVIREKYQKIIDGYVVNDGTFYHYGDWYGTSLDQVPTSDSSLDSYGIILHKVDGKWQITATPEIVFRYSDHKDIPKDVVDAVNQAVND